VKTRAKIIASAAALGVAFGGFVVAGGAAATGGKAVDDAHGVQITQYLHGREATEVTDGKGATGYVYRSDELLPADGLPDRGATQAQVDAWNAEHGDDVTRSPIYGDDGSTVIGTWVTGPAADAGAHFQ
jgi:hypothetical protein